MTKNKILFVIFLIIQLNLQLINTQTTQTATTGSIQQNIYQFLQTLPNAARVT